ncbi:hypothetical protein NOVO_00905 [Rickettsiales bacterium Ac37b]|nr:hypothetical protein NOVO_00905 [Rickettsiales bacterium Ac37b]
MTKRAVWNYTTRPIYPETVTSDIVKLLIYYNVDEIVSSLLNFPNVFLYNFYPFVNIIMLV